MILKALVEMPPSIEGAIDASFTRKRAFYVHNYFLMLISHYTTSLINLFMLRKCCHRCQSNNSGLSGCKLSGKRKMAVECGFRGLLYEFDRSSVFRQNRIMRQEQ
jgi:hypothetical protein